MKQLINLELEEDLEAPIGISKEEYESLIRKSKRIGEEREAYRKMLKTYVPMTGFKVPENPRILNLGCGLCHEAIVLSGYFGGKPFGFDSKDVFVVGIDINEKKIEGARKSYSSIEFEDGKIKYHPRENYQFICGDAIRLRDLVDGEFDIVVARHPNLIDQKDVWIMIFEEANMMTKDKGLFIGSSFTDFEHAYLRECISDAEYFQCLDVKNIHSLYSENLSPHETSYDRNVLFARK